MITLRLAKQPTARYRHLAHLGNDHVSSSSAFTNTERERRVQALHDQLESLGINSVALNEAMKKSSVEGYDTYFGKSAIKAYKTFLFPRDSKIESVKSEDIAIAAIRCARQIDFLAKRNRSHEAEWVRHHDASESHSLSSSRRTYPLILLLDNVRSAFNVGSIFRTADACACEMILTTGITPNPNGSGREKLAKSALNADRVVPSRHFTTTKEALDFLRNEYPGFDVVGMETTTVSQLYTNYNFHGSIGDSTKGTCLVLGNEITGVDTEILPLLDAIIEIPMYGQKNSLNIAACAPIVMYECLRQWGAMNDEETI